MVTIASCVGRSKIYLFTQCCFWGGSWCLYHLRNHPPLPKAFEVHLAVRRLGSLGFSPGRGKPGWLGGWEIRFEHVNLRPPKKWAAGKWVVEIGWDVCRRLDENVWKVCLSLWNGKPVILKYLFWICNNQWSLTYIRMVTITASWGVQKLPCSWDVKRSALFSGPAMNWAGDGWISIFPILKRVIIRAQSKPQIIGQSLLRLRVWLD